jgi:hypothetical protein
MWVPARKHDPLPLCLSFKVPSSCPQYDYHPFCSSLVFLCRPLSVPRTGMNIYAAAFLLPVGVMFYTAQGGLKASYVASWANTGVYGYGVGFRAMSVQR